MERFHLRPVRDQQFRACKARRDHLLVDEPCQPEIVVVFAQTSRALCPGHLVRMAHVKDEAERTAIACGSFLLWCAVGSLRPSAIPRANKRREHNKPALHGVAPIWPSTHGRNPRDGLMASPKTVNAPSASQGNCVGGGGRLVPDVGARGLAPPSCPRSASPPVSGWYVWVS